MDEFDEHLETIKQHIFDATRQNWLFGAGISHEAKIPLMYPLTERVNELLQQAGGKDHEVLQQLKLELKPTAHIEHYLSHLGDLIALAERSRNSKAVVNGNDYDRNELISCYKAVIQAIGDTVRYGYRDSDPPEVGNISDSIVDISDHTKFVNALYIKKSNLERRAHTTFFTTNYDTLLEDALAIRKIDVVDGFSGGAMGFWNPEVEFPSISKRAASCLLYKLHGSIDWHHVETHGLVRVRFGTSYMSDTSDIMIYPQATKYVETQKDPFAALFLGLRSTLRKADQNVLAICGYSFGDDHINSEIEGCLASRSSKTTVVAFVKEVPSEGITVNPVLDRWIQSDDFGDRVFVAGEKGIYYQSLTPCQPSEPRDLDWWKFSGLTSFIEREAV